MLEKNLSNDKSLEVYVVISQKKFSCTIFDKKTDKEQNERKSWELTVCAIGNFDTNYSKPLMIFSSYQKSEFLK